MLSRPWFHPGRHGVLLSQIWLVTLAGVLPAEAQEFAFTSSASVARASYPGAQLTNVYLFNGVDVTAGRLRASFSVPLIRQRTTVTGAELDPSTGTLEPGTYSQSGFGDPLIRVDVRLFEDRMRTLTVGVVGSVKPSLVAADSGLGTGAADVAAGGSFFKAIGRNSLFGEAVYWMYGDPEALEFDDTFSYSIGAGRVIGGGRWSAMLSMAGFSRGLDNEAAPLQLYVAALRLVGVRQSIAITTGFGLTGSSGDFSVGASWRIASRK